MNIIAGSARNLILADLPDQEVRPTAIRSRKALFDSLGAMEGLGVLDLCSGSGAIALEAASRGAAWAAMVENHPAHIECIRENCRRITAAGCRKNLLVIQSDILNFTGFRRQLPGTPDLIFADPPYAISAGLFHKLGADKEFTKFTSGARLIWEIPSAPGAMGEFLNAEFLDEPQFRRFGSTIFLSGKIK
ncbi:MAG: RsmD family RNA methyltransferase [Lentisphaeria bacterium]|nr:RsmD family RNA methyltransferase [Lentisphaeria bacterium]